MTTPNISPDDAAIEAGARAIYRSVNRGHADTKGWDEVKPNWQRSYRRDATAAYYAMAPIIAAAAFDEGVEATVNGSFWPDGSPYNPIVNPYRVGGIGA